MSILKLSDNKLKPTIVSVTALYVASSVMFFIPVDIPHKITICVGILTIASLWLCPWQITAALLFSTLGDYMGSVPDFIGQMGFFAVGHIFYICYFAGRYFRKVESDKKLTPRAIGYLAMIAIFMLALLGITFTKIVPNAPEGIVRIGVSIYAVLISMMFASAMLQRSSLFALGSVLFVFSDFMIAWNKFIEPVPYRDYLVLITYFLAQWLIFIRSTKFRVAPEMRILRF